MRKFITIVILICLIMGAGSADGTIHNLWDIDICNMNIRQIHDYLEQEKGIVSAITFYSNLKNLRSDREQEITLIGYPVTLWCHEYPQYRQIDLDFQRVGTQQDAFTIVNALIEKYGQPTLAFYEMYNRSKFDWGNGVQMIPMYRKVRLLDSIDGFDMLDTLFSWEHFEESKFGWGELSLYLFIDNIEIHISCNGYGTHSVYVTFSSYIPSVEVQEVDESKNVQNYTDTGF